MNLKRDDEILDRIERLSATEGYRAGLEAATRVDANAIYITAEPCSLDYLRATAQCFGYVWNDDTKSIVHPLGLAGLDCREDELRPGSTYLVMIGNPLIPTIPMLLARDHSLGHDWLEAGE